MKDFLQNNERIVSRAGSMDASIDKGLRSFMLGVYNKMALGLLLSAVLAFAAASIEPIRNLIFFTPLYYVVAFGPIGILLLAAFVVKNPSPAMSGLIYWSVVSLLGTGLGALLLVYGSMPGGMEMVAKAFLITSAAFGALSLWGYTTKKDLTGFGSFLIMGVIGLILASIINIFLQSPALHFAVSAIGVLVFAGLIAFDTQNLKRTYYHCQGNAQSMAVATNFGALSLYINFVNLFQFILSLLSMFSRD